MAEYDVFVPLTAATGRRHPSRWLKALKQQLAKRFGGFTYFPQKNEGVWKIGATTFRDRIVILRVLAAASRSSNGYMLRLKREIGRQWKQQTVLIVERRVRML